ncbi:MAG: bifunctional diaminohydroxyphosphoribosylaminopyrimidine deaminase/5-amino-6-(5-phosphoribosylamino)uracil reductase RibD [Cardiobacteriaceae bacterium]|nr:bifunctional diaminohydroxyphosphoribosylaminopyrimidine deaminase/5-amino-6-(5-phosphoribosylamino)uracil reductase RibD [Cardiobacteriaceae bacterium]
MTTTAIQDDFDTLWMRRALSLAEQGIFSTAPNPRVGCIIIKDNYVLGEGWHARAGEAHAEVLALRQSGEDANGATAYVTLEPCAHYGRTPPCADALITAGINRVVVACRDPNPLVAGQGIARLRAAGIIVREGICEKEALNINSGFFRRITTGRPFVTLKLAASLDGRTALSNGESQWITGEAARQDVHKHRLAADAIIAGSSSILKDNARLTARYPTPLPVTVPLRVIIDSRLQTPLNAAVFDDASPILIVCAEHAVAPDYPAHTELLRLPLDRSEHIPLSTVLDALGKRGVNNAFVEAGAALAGAFVQQQLADEILLYLAPCFLGQDARSLIQLPLISRLSDRMRVHIQDCTPLDADLRLRFTLEKTCLQAS